MGWWIRTLLIVATLAPASGCVRRTLSITSSPPGALVWMNDHELGRTPLDVEFLYYGTYDVRLQLAGYETLWTGGEAKAPWWDLPGPDFVAEIVPWEARCDLSWHFALEPTIDDPAGLMERAREMRRNALEGEDSGGPD